MKTDKRFTFLYLRRVKGHVDRAEAGQALFLCPKSLDLVVLGDTDVRLAEELKEFLADASVDTLIYGQNPNFAIPEIVPGVKRVICLSGEEASDVAGYSTGEASNVSEYSVEKTSGATEDFAEKSDDVAEHSAEKVYSRTYQIRTAGWNLAVKNCGNGSLMLAHGLAEDVSNAQSAEDASETCPEAEGEADSWNVSLYKDCVMSVKVVDEKKRCHLEQEPDGYGCALGCSLHQDYDVCNYQRREGQPYVTGTLLLPEVPEECGGSVCDGLIQELKQEFSKTRFFSLPGDMELDTAGLFEGEEPLGCKRYFIGAGPELSDKAVAAVSKSSMYHIPVILEPGKALCCSGFLKYAES